MSFTLKEKDALRVEAAAIKSQQEFPTVRGYSDEIGPEL